MRYDTPVTIAPFLRIAVLLLFAGLVLIPLVATVLGGFKSLGDLRVNPFGLPESWEWDNYWSILSGPRYWHLLLNSQSSFVLLWQSSSECQITEITRISEDIIGKN